MKIAGSQHIDASWDKMGVTSMSSTPVTYWLTRTSVAVRVAVTQGGDGKVSFSADVGAVMGSYPAGLSSTAGRNATVYLSTEGDGVWRLGGAAA